MDNSKKDVDLARENRAERDTSLDALKCILIYFVVLGHVLEEFGVSGDLGTVRSMVYCFHMPTFVFLSGYFSKNTSKAADKALKNCLIPFIIYNTAYCILTGNYSFLTPQYLYWYLLSLFFWRLFSLPISKVRYILPISIIIALYIGTVKEADRFLAISRTLCFFPFFWSGLLFTPEMMKKLRKIHISIPTGCILLCELVVILMNKTGFMPSKMYELIEPYSKTMQDNLVGGILCRLIVLVIGALMLFSILSICRTSSSTLSIVGKRTAAILVFSGFLVKAGSKIGFYLLPWLDTTHSLVVIALSIPIAFIVVLICGNRWVNTLFENINNRLYNMLQTRS